MSDLVNLLLLGNHVFTGLRLRGRSSQQVQPLSLGSLFLAFSFGLFHSLGQKCIIFCWLVLSLLRMQFLQSDTLMFVSQETWSNRTLNPEHFGPGFLTFFVQGLPYNTLVGIIFREIENLQF